MVLNNTASNSVSLGTHYPNRIFVGALPGNANATDLAEFFKKYGTVLEGKIVLDNFGNSRRFGFVTFATSTDAKRVLSQGIIIFKGKQINIGPAVKRSVCEEKPCVNSSTADVNAPATVSCATAIGNQARNISKIPEQISQSMSSAVSMTSQAVYCDFNATAQKALLQNVPVSIAQPVPVPCLTSAPFIGQHAAYLSPSCLGGTQLYANNAAMQQPKQLQRNSLKQNHFPRSTRDLTGLGSPQILNPVIFRF